MDAVAYYDIDLQRGIDKTISFSFFSNGCCHCDYSEDYEETPVDLAGKDALLVVRPHLSPTEVDRLSTENERIKFEDDHTIQVIFPHEVTAGYERRRMVYDLILVDRNDSGEEVRDCILTGQIFIRNGVTHGL